MNIKFEVTLEDLRKNGACYEGYNKVVRALQGKQFSDADSNRKSYIRFAHKATIPLISILEGNGFEDALWVLRCIHGVDRDARLFAVWCARQVLHLMTDNRSVNALDVVERFANNDATDGELSEASAAASAAARDAASAAASAAAWDAAWDAAKAAARAAASAAAWDAASAAAWDAARAEARAEALDEQKDMFIAMCEGRAPWQKTS